MRALILWSSSLLILLAWGPPALPQEGCWRAEEFATNSLNHAKRLYNVDSMEEARLYSDNLLRAAQDTLKAATQCDCPEAQAYAEETIKYARKARQAPGLTEVRIEAENAMGSSEDAIKAAVACGD
jgi:hypothetical protein